MDVKHFLDEFEQHQKVLEGASIKGFPYATRALGLSHQWHYFTIERQGFAKTTWFDITDAHNEKIKFKELKDAQFFLADIKAKDKRLKRKEKYVIVANTDIRKVVG